jgi:multiple sugar transport system permease protein
MAAADRTYTFKKALKNNYKGWLFASPAILGVLIFVAFPMGSSLYYSFTKNDFFNPVQWIGLGNYRQIFSTDIKLVGKSLGTTFLYAGITVPLNLVLSYLLAVLLNVKSKGAKAFRVLYYLPCVIPAIVSGLIMRDVFNPNWGLMNRIFEGLGLPRSKFFHGEKSAMPTLIVTNLFGLGGGMIMWLAQLKSIPAELYESCHLDGGGRLRSFFAITVPMSTPMIFYNLVVSIISSIQIFASVMIITGQAGGTEDSLMFYVVFVYRTAFERLDMGYAAALSWILFAIIAALTFLMFRTSKWVNYAEDR